MSRGVQISFFKLEMALESFPLCRAILTGPRKIAFVAVNSFRDLGEKEGAPHAVCKISRIQILIACWANAGISVKNR